jgi:rod shape-determining protein MreD
MTPASGRGRWALFASLAVALFLTILPMPGWSEDLRPQWVALTLIFWSLALPERVGVFWAFGTGLVLDATTGTLLGQHALGLSVIVYLVVELHRRLRTFPLWQQTLSVWVLLLVERLLYLWVLGATAQPTPSLIYWVPTFTGALLWPWVYAVLRDLGRRAGAL